MQDITAKKQKLTQQEIKQEKQDMDDMEQEEDTLKEKCPSDDDDILMLISDDDNDNAPLKTFTFKNPQTSPKPPITNQSPF